MIIKITVMKMRAARLYYILVCRVFFVFPHTRSRPKVGVGKVELWSPRLGPSELLTFLELMQCAGHLPWAHHQSDSKPAPAFALFPLPPGRFSLRASCRLSSRVSCRSSRRPLAALPRFSRFNNAGATGEALAKFRCAQATTVPHTSGMHIGRIKV